MHFCVAIITEEFPTDNVLEEKLAPFSEDAFYNQFEDEDEDEEHISKAKEDYPMLLWDWWQVGGRYSGYLKLKADYNDLDTEYKWCFLEKTPRAGRLFRSGLLERLNQNSFYYEESAFGYLGISDGYIRVDGCKVKDAINFEEIVINHGVAFIGKDGQVFAREWWNGDDWIKDEQYEEKVKEAIKDVDDCYVCFVDCHT